MFDIVFSALLSIIEMLPCIVIVIIIFYFFNRSFR